VGCGTAGQAVPLDAGRAGPGAARCTSACWCLTTALLKVLATPPRRCSISVGRHLPVRLEGGRWSSLGDVVGRHFLLLLQRFLKDGPFPAQGKAEFRVRLQLVFVCTAGNKSVFLLSFCEVPIPGWSLLQLAGTSPPRARGSCSRLEAEPRRQTSVWPPAQTRSSEGAQRLPRRVADLKQGHFSPWRFLPLKLGCLPAGAVQLQGCKPQRWCREVKKTEVTICLKLSLLFPSSSINYQLITEHA